MISSKLDTEHSKQWAIVVCPNEDAARLLHQQQQWAELVKQVAADVSFNVVEMLPKSSSPLIDMCVLLILAKINIIRQRKKKKINLRAVFVCCHHLEPVISVVSECRYTKNTHTLT